MNNQQTSYAVKGTRNDPKTSNEEAIVSDTVGDRREALRTMRAFAAHGYYASVYDRMAGLELIAESAPTNDKELHHERPVY